MACFACRVVELMQFALYLPVYRIFGAALLKLRVGGRFVRAVLALLVLALVLPVMDMACAHAHSYRYQRTRYVSAASKASIKLEAMPELGQRIYHAIVNGETLPHEKDGSIFGNRERILPLRKRGYYREYTVAHPNVSNRGAQRIVCGGAITRPDVCYYSADHYNSFQKIIP